MEFSVGDSLIVDGDYYKILGKIQYINQADRCSWFEYRLFAPKYNQERWLSIDEIYREYALYKRMDNPSTSGYHQVDCGTQEVLAIWGDVDVSVGECAQFVEYEDVTEEKIISYETWDTEIEKSTGYYLDDNEIMLSHEDYRPGASYRTPSSATLSLSPGKLVLFLVIGAFFFFNLIIGFIRSVNYTPSIKKYLEKSSYYTYQTSITGNLKEKADVFQSSLSLEDTAKDIIDNIEGNTNDVQQNTEDGDQSIAILTNKEYCLIYLGKTDNVLVQISSRKYSYGTDSELYEADHSTQRYYRRFYYSRAFTKDSSRYKKELSPYRGFEDVDLSNNLGDPFRSYSNTVRQASIDSRQSSGGGISSGK